MRLFYRVTWIALILSVAMTILSAYIRLADSGIGCAPWPDCFAEQFVIDPQPGIAISEVDPHRGLRMTHRIMASAFALSVLIMTIFSLWYRARLGVNPLWTIAIFLLTVALSVVGINTPDVLHPAVTGINLTGGMLLAALLFHLVLIQRPLAALPADAGSVLTLVCVSAVVLVVASGSWVSGNFAAGHCDGLLSCPGVDEAAVSKAFDLDRELVVNENRMNLGADQALIAYAHHVLALVSLALVLITAVTIWLRRGPNPALLASVATALALGLLGIVETGSPDLLTASLHNFLALLLLLVLIYQYNLYRPRHD